MEDLQIKREKVEEVKDKKWCVYIHTNKINSKAYIGITSRNIIRRWGSNGNGYKQDDNPVFYNAIQKYGWDNFEHIVWADNLSEKEAKEWEIRLIAIFKTNCRKYKNPELGYNMNDGGDGNSGHVLSAESRKKISDHHADVTGENNPMYGKVSAMRGKTHNIETKKRLSEINKGKVLSEETKQKLRETHLGKKATEETKEKLRKINSGQNNPMYGEHHTEETKRKISDANKAIWTEERRKQFSEQRKGMNSRSKHPQARKVVKLTIDNIFIEMFGCIKDAAESINVNESTIRYCCKSRQKTSGGFKWMYLEDYERMINKNAEDGSMQ